MIRDYYADYAVYTEGGMGIFFFDYLSFIAFAHYLKVYW